MKKKSLIGWVDKSWETNFSEIWGTIHFPYINIKKREPFGKVVFDDIKIKITIEEI